MNTYLSSRPVYLSTEHMKVFFLRYERFHAQFHWLTIDSAIYRRGIRTDFDSDATYTEPEVVFGDMYFIILSISSAPQT